MRENNAICAICGKKYHVCVSCEEKRMLNPWKLHTDTSEHYKIFQILHGYSTGFYTKQEAKEHFEHVDLSDLESFKLNVKSVIRSILDEGTNDNDKNVKKEDIETSFENTDKDTTTNKNRNNTSRKK